jgi:hypothetical protein
MKKITAGFVLGVLTVAAAIVLLAGYAASEPR